MSPDGDSGPGPARDRILVLGATGFIGRWVVRVLDRAGATVVPHARSEDRAREVLRGTDALERLAVADVARPGRVDDLLGRVGPAVVFNLVGYGVDRGERDEETAFRINAEVVGEVCRATARHGRARRDGVRLVHVGSALEYGRADGDLSEDTDPVPTTLYGRSKLAGTRELRRFSERHGFPALTARLFTVFGPGEHAGRLLPSLMAAADTGSPIDLTEGRQERDFTYVEDVVEGLLRLARSDPRPGETVNLATGTLTSVRDFVLEAADVLGLSEQQLRFGARPTRDEEMSHDAVAVDRLKELTDWRPGTSVRTGIQRTRDHVGSRSAGDRGGAA